MKARPFWKQGHSAPAVITLLAALVLAACGVQTSGAPTPQATGLPLAAGIPLTGPTSAPTARLAPSPTPLSAANASPQPAPACQSPATLTPAVTEGPYFKANSPERASLLETAMSGTRLTLTGYVLTTDCRPVAGALLDFWQANAEGQYDNVGYTLRGHQYTDSAGRYHLDTVVPGLYPGRTEHIHVKVQAPNGPLLTTQLFFPGSADNQSDQFYNPALLITLQSSGSPMQASYDFVVNTR